MKNKLVIITGPTAIGKSKISVELSKRFNGEVISADSMQVYKGMDIGTGKIKPCEMQGVIHHLLDIADPDEYFTVFDFISKAKERIDKINEMNKIPFLVGGTGLYINGLINGHNFAGASKDDRIRAKLEKEAEEKGKEYLFELLKTVDPVSADKISPNDLKRVIRALEIYEVTGRPKSSNITTDIESIYDYLMFVIVPTDRNNLYNEIDKRVDEMIGGGLVDEVKKLISYQKYNSMQAIGYKEIISYLNGEITLEAAVELIKMNSRRYAKRQLTYFKHMKAEKIFVEKNGNILQFMSNIIRERYGIQ